MPITQITAHNMPCMGMQGLNHKIPTEEDFVGVFRWIKIIKTPASSPDLNIW